MTVQRSIRMDESVYQWLAKLAKEDSRSISDIIRLILLDAMAHDWKP